MAGKGWWISLIISLLLYVVLAYLQLKFTPIWYDDACHYLSLLSAQDTNLLNTFCIESQTQEIEQNARLVTVGPAVHYPILTYYKTYPIKLLATRVYVAGFGLVGLLVLALFTHYYFRSPAYLVVFLLGFNIQYLTYGTQYIGEVPALAYLVCGVVCSAYALRFQSLIFAFSASIFFNFSILSKEYIALPIGLAIFFTFLFSIINKNYHKAPILLIMGIFLPIGTILIYYNRFEHWQEFQSYWQKRQCYQAEFVALTLEPFRFILYKPLILLGTLALVAQVYARKKLYDIFLLCLQLILVVLFLLSAGYDRFGLWLLWIPSIYIGRYIIFFFYRLEKINLSRINKIGIYFCGVFFFYVLFIQNTLTITHQRMLGIPNLAEKKAVSWLIEANQKNPRLNKVFTYELTLIPFLIEQKIHYRTDPTPPACRKDCKRLNLNPNEYFICGEYARTEFINCWEKKDYRTLDSIKTNSTTYYILVSN